MGKHCKKKKKKKKGGKYIISNSWSYMNAKVSLSLLLLLLLSLSPLLSLIIPIFIMQVVGDDHNIQSLEG